MCAVKQLSPALSGELQVRSAKPRLHPDRKCRPRLRPLPPLRPPQAPPRTRPTPLPSAHYRPRPGHAPPSSPAGRPAHPEPSPFPSLPSGTSHPPAPRARPFPSPHHHHPSGTFRDQLPPAASTFSSRPALDPAGAPTQDSRARNPSRTSIQTLKNSEQRRWGTTLTRWGSRAPHCPLPPSDPPHPATGPPARSPAGRDAGRNFRLAGRVRESRQVNATDGAGPLFAQVSSASRGP